MKNILFRADSSAFIGTGHIMRDLVLAGQFKNANIIFATQDLPGNINDKIIEKKYSLEILASNDVEELINIINKYAIDMIVIDHYAIDYQYEQQLKDRTGIKIFVLDDTYEKHCCDILLNHNIYAEESKYQGLVSKNTELRCGTKYTLIRDEFIQEKQKAKIKRNDAIKNVLVAMGGADHANKNIEILQVLAEFPNICANVVTTTANAHLAELQDYVKSYYNVVLHINTDKMAKLMNESDFAIVTPSVTLNEVFYMELPFIAIKTAENQIEMYEYLKQNNYFVLDEINKNKLIKYVEFINGR